MYYLKKDANEVMKWKSITESTLRVKHRPERDKYTILMLYGPNYCMDQMKEPQNKSKRNSRKKYRRR